MLEVFASDLIDSVFGLNCWHIATKGVSYCLCLGNLAFKNHSPLCFQAAHKNLSIVNALKMELYGKQVVSKSPHIQKRVPMAQILLLHHIPAL